MLSTARASCLPLPTVPQVGLQVRASLRRSSSICTVSTRGLSTTLSVYQSYPSVSGSRHLPQSNPTESSHHAQLSERSHALSTLLSRAVLPLTRSLPTSSSALVHTYAPAVNWACRAP